MFFSSIPARHDSNVGQCNTLLTSFFSYSTAIFPCFVWRKKEEDVPKRSSFCLVSPSSLCVYEALMNEVAPRPPPGQTCRKVQDGVALDPNSTRRQRMVRRRLETEYISLITLQMPCCTSENRSCDQSKGHKLLLHIISIGGDRLTMITYHGGKITVVTSATCLHYLAITVGTDLWRYGRAWKRNIKHENWLT